MSVEHERLGKNTDNLACHHGGPFPVRHLGQQHGKLVPAQRATVSLSRTQARMRFATSCSS